MFSKKEPIPTKSSPQSAARLVGLTRLNFIARSGVVSGQSSSKVIGIDRARSNSANSSWVKAGSFIVSCGISAAFTIIDTPFEVCGQTTCRIISHYIIVVFIFLWGLTWKKLLRCNHKGTHHSSTCPASLRSI